MAADVDIVVIGGGFYGCALALYLRSVANSIVVLEAKDGLLARASRVNQARVHAGFHYPRSFVTALRSRIMQEHFARDFHDAIVSDYDMLYAIAARRSKVSPARFWRMFQSVHAPIAPAGPRHRSLFDRKLVDEVFLCKEFAFDWSILRDRLTERLTACGIQVMLGARVEDITVNGDRMVLALGSGDVVTGRQVFNVTYANINSLLLRNHLPPLPLKYELAEIALVRPPPELEGCAVTVMDGPFFSTMPYPAQRLYSLTHVRYTPHYAWLDDSAGSPADQVAANLPRRTRWRHMMMDASRYVPCLRDLRYEGSLFDVKTVWIGSESDDGRPILIHRHRDGPLLCSVLGSKIDNIYDLFGALPSMSDGWKNANTRYLLG
jgi:glycine/D-amino acid oxidase-like deaminating enzyme